MAANSDVNEALQESGVTSQELVEFKNKFNKTTFVSKFLKS